MPTPSKNTENKVFDVAKPGRTAPSSTTRPLIVGHGVIIQDPMVNAKTPPSNVPAKDEAPAEEKSELVVTPPKEEASKAPEKPAEEKPPEVKPTEKTPDSTDNADSGAIDELASQSAKKKQDADAEEKAKTKQIEMDKLIAEKKYLIPIGQVTRRNNNRVAIVILVLLALLVAAYLLIDAGVIDVGLKLPVNLIK